MARNYANYIYRAILHGKFYSSPFRSFHTSQRLEHDPNLKKKKKLALDQAKEKSRKDKQAAKRRAEPIFVPVDPDSMPGMK